MKRLLQGSAMRAISAYAIGLYLDVALRLARWRIEADPATWDLLTGRHGETAIVVFWHEYLPAVPVLWWHARRANRSLSLNALVSRHRDGRLIGRVMQRWGIGLVEGSTEKPGKAPKGGAASLRGMLGLLRRGELVSLTPDGPRGPRRVMNPGVAHLAAVSGVRVVPIAARCTPRLRARSWDRMLLPLPFGRGSIVCGAPIAVARGGADEAVARLGEALRALDTEPA